MSEHLIQVQNLKKIYGSGEIAVHALAGVDVGIEQGEFVAIMGPSGSGKSTLMNILGCLDRPTSGAYVLDGEDVSELSKEELADARTADLRKLVNAMAGREVRMADLKDVIRKLRAQLQDAGMRPVADDPLLGEM